MSKVKIKVSRVDESSADVQIERTDGVPHLHHTAWIKAFHIAVEKTAKRKKFRTVKTVKVIEDAGSSVVVIRAADSNLSIGLEELAERFAQAVATRMSKELSQENTEDTANSVGSEVAFSGGCSCSDSNEEDEEHSTEAECSSNSDAPSSPDDDPNGGEGERDAEDRGNSSASDSEPFASGSEGDDADVSSSGLSADSGNAGADEPAETSSVSSSGFLDDDGQSADLQSPQSPDGLESSGSDKQTGTAGSADTRRTSDEEGGSRGNSAGRVDSSPTGYSSQRDEIGGGDDKGWTAGGSSSAEDGQNGCPELSADAEEAEADGEGECPSGSSSSGDGLAGPAADALKGHGNSELLKAGLSSHQSSAPHGSSSWLHELDENPSEDTHSYGGGGGQAHGLSSREASISSTRQVELMLRKFFSSIEDLFKKKDGFDRWDAKKVLCACSYSPHRLPRSKFERPQSKKISLWVDVSGSVSHLANFIINIIIAGCKDRDIQVVTGSEAHPCCILPDSFAREGKSWTAYPNQFSYTSSFAEQVQIFLSNVRLENGQTIVIWSDYMDINARQEFPRLAKLLRPFRVVWLCSHDRSYEKEYSGNESFEIERFARKQGHLFLWGIDSPEGIRKSLREVNVKK